MNDLILEIDSYLWWAVIALAVLAVVLSALKSDVKTAGSAEYDIALPPSHEEERPAGTYREMSKPVDTTISEYRSAKLQSCKREIVMLERLGLITDLPRRVEPEQTPGLITREQPETEQKRDHGTKKRGFLD